MKKSWFAVILLIAVVFIACCVWLGPVLITYLNSEKNPPLPDHLKALSLSKTRRMGNVVVARLQSPAVIEGFPCDANWIHFDETGRMKAFYAGETCTIQGYEMPKGTWVRLNPDQTLRYCAFSEDVKIQEYVCDGGKGGSEGVTTGFYPSGRLESFFSPNDIEIQGIPCKGGPFNAIYFYENGNLKEITLSKDAVIGGRALSAGQRVSIDEAGRVLSVSNPSLIERAGSWLNHVLR